MSVRSGLFALTAIGLLAVGCGPPMRWDKAGASIADVVGDQRDCRRAASDEAFSTYAFNSGFAMMGPPFWGFHHRPDYFMWRQRVDSDRAFMEMRLASFCMRNKGYMQVPVNEQPAPTPAPPPK